MKLPSAHEMTREQLKRALLRVRHPDIFYVSGKHVRAGEYNRTKPFTDEEKKEFAPFLQELNSATYEELESLYEKDRPAREELFRRTQEAFEEREPFNQPYAIADAAYCAKASYWDLDEMTALSIGRDPRRVNKGQFQMAQYTSPVAKMYTENRELIERAQKMGQLFPHTIPTVFIAWAGRVGLNLPAEIRTAVEALGNQVADWKTLLDQAQEMNTKLNGLVEKQSATIKTQKATISALTEERDRNRVQAEQQSNEKLASTDGASTKRTNTLLKLLGAMAFQKYGWRPGKSPSPAKQIAGATQDVNASVSENTIRDRLSEAAELIDIPDPEA